MKDFIDILNHYSKEIDIIASEQICSDFYDYIKVRYYSGEKNGLRCLQ